MALTVLCPLDGSDRSHAALDTAMGMLGGLPDLRVVLFTALQEGFEDADEGVVEMFDVDEDDEIFPTVDSAERMLDEAAELCAKHGVEADQKVVVGAHYKAILAEVEEGGYDLVVMHALDKSQVKEKLRLSQTEKLARNVGTSVLLVGD